ncbi:MAG TPA: phosphate ABC transporter substrate-binding/OmpA family protein [Thermoanaerobaculia bacterium]|nr:phosphate ABC transporter substrate-binding/OmpA family protein [Thermoanaerobaculia bacterium]
MADPGSSDVKLKPAAWLLMVLVVLALVALGIYSGRSWLFPQGTKAGNVSKSDLPNGGQAEKPGSPGITTVSEYKYVPTSRLPAVKGTANYKPLVDNTVVMGLNVWAGWAPIFWANGGTEPSTDSLFYKKYGFKVAIKIIDSPSESINAFASGNIHATAWTLDMIPLFYEQLKADSRALPRAFLQVDWSNGGDGIVVRKNINSIADLKGKTVALAQHSPSHYLLLNLLINAGLQPSDVDFRFTEDAFQAAAAFNADKSLAACVSWSPDIYKLSQAPGNKLLVSTSTANKLISDVMFARADFVRDNPKIVDGLTRGFFDAVEALKDPANRKRAATLMGQAYKIKTDDAVAMLGDAHSTNYAENREFFLNENNPTNFERYWETASTLYLKLGSIGSMVRFDQVMDFSAIKSLEAVEPYASSKDEYAVTFTPKGVSAIKAEASEILTNVQRIHFYTNSFDLFHKNPDGTLYDPNAAKILEDVAKLAGQFGMARITIEGHTDASMKGYVPEQAVKDLSMSRANAVKEELVKRFHLQPNQFSVDGVGWDHPLDAGNDALNRRVEIKVFPLEQQPGG